MTVRRQTDTTYAASASSRVRGRAAATPPLASLFALDLALLSLLLRHDTVSSAAET